MLNKVVDSVSAIPKHEMKKTSIPAISSINNIQFDSTGIHTWKAFNIGPGKHIQIDSHIIPKIMIKDDSCEIQFHSLSQHTNTSSRKETSDGTFSCKNEECILSFPTYESMEGHMLIGDCELTIPDRSSVDVVKTTYLEKLHSSNSLPISMDCVSTICHDIKQSKGWAMKEERKCKRFNDKQKNYLVEKFNKGAVTGQNEDPEKVSADMKTAKGDDGKRLFLLEEFLTSQQIISFFSRYYRKNSAVQEQLITNIEVELS